MKRAIGVIAVAACALTAGCTQRDDLLVWKIELSSPDGSFVARADTVQNGGFGTASIDTTVFLRRANSPAPGHAVVVLECDGPVPHPYVLDNGANKGGTVHLKLHWDGPSHLSVTYDGRARKQMHETRYNGMTISLTETSDN
jgi:hypothetical protein